MKMSIPSEVLWVMQQIEQVNEEVFLVGGCVRDYLLQREIHDYDLTTSMPAHEMMELFSKRDCKVIPTGLQHGTITIIHKHTPVEITTYRIDQGYEGHRSPSSVQYTKSLHEDLKRRDFTINAIAYHPSTGFIDIFQGMQDIEQKIIRCVGDATLRFQEDALRILRAIRFRCQLHFEIDNETKASILSQHTLLKYISKERIRDEFIKLVLSDAFDLLQFLRSLNILSYILPGIDIIYDFEQHSPWHCYDVFKHTDIALNHANGTDLQVKLAIILHDIGKVKAQTFKGIIAHYYGHAKISAELAKHILSSLAFPKKLILEVCTLIRYHDTYVMNRSQMRKLLYRLGNNFDQMERLLIIQACDDSAKIPEKVIQQKQRNLDNRNMLEHMRQEHDILDKKEMLVNGTDMIKLGFQNREIQEVLDYLFMLILKTPANNTKEKLIAFAINYKSNKNKNLQGDQTHDHKDR